MLLLALREGLFEGRDCGVQFSLSILVHRFIGF
jgi:hypothetical protein